MQPESWGSFPEGKGMLFYSLLNLLLLLFQKDLVKLLMQNAFNACVWVWAASKAVAQCFVFKLLDSNVP